MGKAISKLLSPRYATSDTALQDYLADVAEGRFESARAAQKYLIELDIPTRKFWEVEPQAISPVESVELEKTPRKEGLKKIRSIFYILLPIVLFGSWGWWLTRKLATANVTLLEEAVYHDFSQGCFDGEGDIDRCQMAKAIDLASQQDLIPSDFTIYYTSIWKYFLESSSFNTELRKRQGNGNKIEWNWRLTDFNRFNELSLGDRLLITHDRAEIFNQRNMARSIIAYDGLVALVSPKLAEVLNGKISREQLQEIYRGTLQEWNQIEGVENFNKEIVLLRPRNAEFVKLFQGLLFGELANTVVENSRAVDNILEEVAKANDAAIAFAPLSFVMGQCSVYPLAIVGENGTVQAFVDTYGKPITPQTDLCDDKGGYTANFNKLVRERAYPLSYRVVAYRETGNETPPLFVELMTTDEGQSLLRALGLVPCRIPGEEFCQFPEQS
ncbi:substrate-binding domain-containing protein [Baaleninema sp.]|uniref:substrate-binding domain-containing protein n=1 Tax=Baaleninema sp. TaxID=3101197 RepID=UPI003CFC33F4